jgi:hypothetical protein
MTMMSAKVRRHATPPRLTRVMKSPSVIAVFLLPGEREIPAEPTNLRFSSDIS